MKKEHTVTMSMADLLTFRAVLSQYGNVTKAKAGYFVARNLTLTESYEKDYHKVLTPSDAQKELEKAREDLLKSHAVRDEKGNPIKKPVPQRPGVWQWELENQEAFEKELAELRASDEYAEGVKDEEALDEKRTELLEMEHEVKLYRIPFNELLIKGDGDSEETVFRAADIAVFMKYDIIVDED